MGRGAVDVYTSHGDRGLWMSEEGTYTGPHVCLPIERAYRHVCVCKSIRTVFVYPRGNVPPEPTYQYTYVSGDFSTYTVRVDLYPVYIRL